MREMTDAFNEDAVVENICRYLHMDSRDFLPHGVTLNEFLERMDSSFASSRTSRFFVSALKHFMMPDFKGNGSS